MSKIQMSKRTLSLACVLAMGVPLSALAATATQINAAIDNGLAYLASGQTGGGYWNYGGYEQAATGAAAFAMLSQQSRWGTNAATYQTQVDNAIAYLLSTATTAAVSTRYNDPATANICPGGSGSCTAVYWYGSGESTYTTGLVASAIATYAAAHPNAVATSTGPLAGMTWKEIAQGITNTYAAAQATSAYGDRWGGWRYGLPQNNDADSSTTQWAAISMLYDQTLGATTPQVTKDDLKNHWLPAAQRGDGAACYQPGAEPCDNADTGGMLLSLNFVGKGASDPAAVSAMNFLNSTWKQGANSTWYGNFGSPYAMWAEYKGLETTIGLDDNTHITNLVGCGIMDPGATCNWWQDMNEYLVTSQGSSGAWGGYAYWGEPLATAFYLPILGGTEIPSGNTTPEPGTLALVGLAVGGLAMARRRTFG